VTDQNDIPRIDVVRGDPTPEELAAIVAVLSEEYAAEAAEAVADDRPRTDAWTRARRLRRVPQRGRRWGRFGG
jgi:hypothetical protein